MARPDRPAADMAMQGIRPAGPADLASIVGLVRELAEYERSADQVALDEEALATALFADPAAAGCLVVEDEGDVVAMALYFWTFSTWTGRRGIWLEDLYVRPSARRRGLGRALVASLADLAVRSGCERLDWAVLDWNQSAWDFYATLGARPLEEWTMHRVTGPALRELAGSNEPMQGPCSVRAAQRPADDSAGRLSRTAGGKHPPSVPPSGGQKAP